MFVCNTSIFAACLWEFFTKQIWICNFIVVIFIIKKNCKCFNMFVYCCFWKKQSGFQQLRLRRLLCLCVASLYGKQSEINVIHEQPHTRALAHSRGQRSETVCDTAGRCMSCFPRWQFYYPASPGQMGNMSGGVSRRRSRWRSQPDTLTWGGNLLPPSERWHCQPQTPGQSSRALSSVPTNISLRCNKTQCKK